MQLRLEAKVRRITGKSVHRIGGMPDEHGHLAEGVVLPPPDRVRIEENDGGFLLLYLDASGTCQADGFHLTVADAKKQAKFEFEIEESDWHEVHE